MSRFQQGHGWHFDTWWPEPQTMTLDQYLAGRAHDEAHERAELLPELSPAELLAVDENLT